MIKIITPGHRTYRKRCSYCECCFRFDEEDIKHTEIIDDHGGIPMGKTDEIQCPYCGMRLNVYKSDLYAGPKEETCEKES